MVDVSYELFVLAYEYEQRVLFGHAPCMAKWGDQIWFPRPNTVTRSINSIENENLEGYATHRYDIIMR